jgi:hypothetical protein
MFRAIENNKVLSSLFFAHSISNLNALDVGLIQGILSDPKSEMAKKYVVWCLFSISKTLSSFRIA